MRKSTTVHFLSRIDLFLHSVPPLSPCSKQQTEERQHPPKSSRLWQMDRLDAWILHRLWPLCRRGFCVVLFPNSTTTTRRLHRNFYFSIFNHQLCLFVFFLFFFISSILTGCADVAEQLIARVETRWRTCAAWSQVMPNSIRSSGVTRLRSSAHSADRTRLPIRGVTGNVARPFPGSTPAQNHGGLSSDTRPAPTSREPRVQVKMKASTTKLELIAVEMSTHSFMRRNTCRLISRSWNFHSAQCPHVLGLPVFFNYWLEQEGTKRRRPTNLFWIDGLWRCMYGGVCRAFESFMFVWLWPKLTCVCLWE